LFSNPAIITLPLTFGYNNDCIVVPAAVGRGASGFSRCGRLNATEAQFIAVPSTAGLGTYHYSLARFRSLYLAAAQQGAFCRSFD